MKAMALCLIAVPAIAAADDYPPPGLEFYIGHYQLIGKSASGALVDTMLRLDASGTDLQVTMCGLPDAGRLVLPEVSGGDHYIEGRIGDHEVVCDPFMTYQNDALLACYTDAGALLTLWPGPVLSAALDCGN